jgi:hypothetical protein
VLLLVVVVAVESLGVLTLRLGMVLAPAVRGVLLLLVMLMTG